MLVKTLVALATEKMLLKTSGKTFLRGIDFMYAAGLAPERLSVMMTQSGKYVLQFHSKCDIRPFAANYPSFSRVLRGIVHVRAWRIKSLEFVNVAFDMKDVDNLERAIDKPYSDAAPVRFEVEKVVVEAQKFLRVKMGVNTTELTGSQRNRSNIFIHARAVLNRRQLIDWLKQEGNEKRQECAFALPMRVTTNEFAASRVVLDLPGTASIIEAIPVAVFSKGLDQDTVTSVGIDEETNTAGPFDANDFKMPGGCNRTIDQGTCSFLAPLLNMLFPPAEAVKKLGVELVLLRNCTYPGVRRGDEAIRFLNALNRKKQAVVCEYGDDRLKHRISRRNRPTPSNRVPFPARARLDAEDAVDNQPVDEEWDQNEAMEGPDEPENVGGRDVMDVDDMADGGGAEGRQNDRVDAVIRRLRDVAEGGAGLQRRIAQRRVAGGGIDRRADRSHQQQRRLMLAAVDVLMGGAGGGRPAQEDARLYPRRRSGRLAAQAAAAAVGVVQPPVAPDIEELRVPAQGAEAAGLAPIGGRDGDIPERFLEAFREHEEILRRAFQLQEQLLQAAPPLLGRLEELQFGGARHGIPPRHAPDEPEVAGAEDVRDAEEEAVEEEEEDVDGL